MSAFPYPRHILNFTAHTSEHARDLINLGNQLWIYCTPCLIIGGTIGNVLAIVTFCRSSFRHSPCTFLMFALAVVDTLVLDVCAIEPWFSVAFDLHIRLLNRALCKLHLSFTYFIIMLSAWTITLITIERVISVMWPLHAIAMCSKRKIIVSWSTLVAVVAGLNAQYLFTADVTQDGCIITHYPDLSSLGAKADAVLSCFLPACLILVGNFVIVVRYAMSLSQRANMTESNSSSGGDIGSLTTMLVVVCIVFLVTVLPLNLFLLLSPSYETLEDVSEAVAQNFLIFVLVSLLGYVNSATNFILYFVSGSRFRRAFVKVIGC